MTNRSKIILDLFGLMVTPGHAFYCAEGSYKGQHAPLIDILRSDGAIQHKDGTIIRAATGVPCGAREDSFVWAVVGELQPDGKVVVSDKGKLRLGTRFITDDGKDLSIADLIKSANGTLTDEGLIQFNGATAPVPFYWMFDDTLPKPEDYILKRSGTTLESIYKASEWEQHLPHMPPPADLSGAPVQPLTQERLVEMQPNVPLSASGDTNQTTMSRKQRRAQQAKQRKATKRAPNDLH
ncbi:hypothetical protein JM93_03509 [Roseibium hamelinense]|uniref:Hint domain-containing protein n=1 Tax=Roseibium hamelinense TaxID=150831 RepID=A0A562SLK3_9HYPH|nr:hypothetical protein [Roseibium hamelinense]MTI44905.1 hypothetical protein [Roseibium hamelinense]TWI82165.1 hypothetical protein JM93_03509 [Roseibium hamelinense]